MKYFSNENIDRAKPTTKTKNRYSDNDDDEDEDEHNEIIFDNDDDVETGEAMTLKELESDAKTMEDYAYKIPKAM